MRTGYGRRISENGKKQRSSRRLKSRRRVRSTSHLIRLTELICRLMHKRDNHQASIERWDYFSLSSGAGLLALLAKRPPNPPRSRLKNFPRFFRFSLSFAPVSTAPAPNPKLDAPAMMPSVGGL